MSIWDSFRGHEEQREMLRRTIRRKRLSQAYLFVGPSGIGKHRFAQNLAQCLLCRRIGEDPLEPCGQCESCLPFLAGSHPDFLHVDCPEGKRELPIALIVGPDDRRGQEGLCHDLSLGALPGSRKVAIVDDADSMTEAGANAFLKTLEEPPERAVLLLIASNLDALLPTIRSRCQLVRFSALSNNDVRSLLLENGLVNSDADADFASALSEGSLTTAVQLLEPELKLLRTLLYSQLSQLNFSGFGLSKQLVEGLGKISNETSEQRRNALWLIRFAVEFLRAALWKLNGCPVEPSLVIDETDLFIRRIGHHTDAVEVIAGMIDRSIDSLAHLDQNITVPMTLDSLFNDLARSLRPLAAHR